MSFVKLFEKFNNRLKTLPKQDYRYKRSEYAGLAIPEYWIVDPLENKVSVLVLEEGFYEVAEFKGTQPIVSPTFKALVVTPEQILAV